MLDGQQRLTAMYYAFVGARACPYADLRELQDIIVSKAAWPAFQPWFGTKEMLNLRFGQLAELRNGIRHSRHVDVITRKEGEAAILWLTQVLCKASPVSPSTDTPGR
jgi:hypothetical protein